MLGPIIVHINCFEQGQGIEEACRKCSEWGYDGIEFRSGKGQPAPVSEYLDTISRYTEKYKVKYVLFGSPGLQKVTGSRAEREAELEELVDFYESASERFHLTICNSVIGPILNPVKSIPYVDYTKHGSYTATEEHWDWAVYSYKVLGDLARKKGFVFAFEIHRCYLNDTIESTIRLVDMIDNPAVGINLDYGNIVYYKDYPSLKDTINQIGDRLYYVHLKNSVDSGNGGRIPTGLADGDINHREYLKILEERKYEGPVCIEFPIRGDREWHARRDLAYLKGLMQEI